MKKETTTAINKKLCLIKLAERYTQIAIENNVTTASELSKLTYTAREAGEDIPYLAVSTKNSKAEIYTPVPVSKQKNWTWISKMELTDDEYYSLWVETIFEFGVRVGLMIYIKQKIKVNGVSQRTIIYSWQNSKK